MEYAINEFGQPVIYIVNYSYSDQYVQENYFVSAAPTLEDAKSIKGMNGCHEIVEQNMLTGEKVQLHIIERQREEKEMLVSLYKSGFKRKAFEGLDIRKPFQEQLDFPITPEMDKAKKQGRKLLLPV